MLTLDKIISEDIKIYQNKEGYRFNIDSVLLADFIKTNKKDRVIDLGTGSGVIPIILGKFRKFEKITGIEIQKSLATLANKNIRANKFENKIEIIHKDFRKLTGKFDVIISNPPYREFASGRINPNKEKAIARHEIKCNLEDIFKTAKRISKPKTKFYIIYGTRRFSEVILKAKKHNFEPKEIRFIHPKNNEPSNIFIAKFVYDGKTELKILSPLYVYKKQGEYTDEVKLMLNKRI